MPKISVIIPVYNTEQYLKKCLDSVCKQTFKDIEIICINDCSPDSSLEILKEYQKNDHRIKIIDFKENKGGSAVRNEGIKLAKGEYIGFVDPDDYIDLDFYGKLYYKYSTSADIIKGGDINVIYPNGENEVWAQNEAIKENKINFYSQFTTAIFKRDFLIQNEISFPEEMKVCEDIFFVTKSAILANKIEIVDNANYYYIRHENSLDSNKYDGKRVDSVMNYVEKISKLINEYDLPLSDKQIILSRIVAQLDKIRKYKVENNSEDYKKLTKLYQQKVIEKMRLK